MTMRLLGRFLMGFMMTAAAVVALWAAPGGSEAPTEVSSKAPEGLSKATFAGGCFWCMEAPFDRVDGVISTTSGYTGGPEKNPGYRAVASGRTGHAEAVEVLFDPKKVSYSSLLEVYWHNIDPTAKDRQFCDAGRQYRTAIYTHGATQALAARRSKAALVASKVLPGPVHTEIVAAGAFFVAEAYHQDFYKKNPAHYSRYRQGCGRDRRLMELWGAQSGH